MPKPTVIRLRRAKPASLLSTEQREQVSTFTRELAGAFQPFVEVSQQLRTANPRGRIKNARDVAQHILDAAREGIEGQHPRKR